MRFNLDDFLDNCVSLIIGSALSKTHKQRMFDRKIIANYTKLKYSALPEERAIAAEAERTILPQLSRAAISTLSPPSLLDLSRSIILNTTGFTLSNPPFNYQRRFTTYDIDGTVHRPCQLQKKGWSYPEGPTNTCDTRVASRAESARNEQLGSKKTTLTPWMYGYAEATWASDEGIKSLNIDPKDLPRTLELVRTFPVRLDEMTGAGRYRVANDISSEETTQILLHQTGDMIELIGAQMGDTKIRGHEHVTYGDIARIKEERSSFFRNNSLLYEIETDDNGAEIQRGFPQRPQLLESKTVAERLRSASWVARDPTARDFNMIHHHTLLDVRSREQVPTRQGNLSRQLQGPRAATVHHPAQKLNGAGPSNQAQKQLTRARHNPGEDKETAITEKITRRDRQQELDRAAALAHQMQRNITRARNSKDADKVTAVTKGILKKGPQQQVNGAGPANQPQRDPIRAGYNTKVDKDIAISQKIVEQESMQTDVVDPVQTNAMASHEEIADDSEIESHDDLIKELNGPDNQTIPTLEPGMASLPIACSHNRLAASRTSRAAPSIEFGTAPPNSKRTPNLQSEKHSPSRKDKEDPVVDCLTDIEEEEEEEEAVVAVDRCPTTEGSDTTTQFEEEIFDGEFNRRGESFETISEQEEAKPASKKGKRRADMHRRTRTMSDMRSATRKQAPGLKPETRSAPVAQGKRRCSNGETPTVHFAQGPPTEYEIPNRFDAAILEGIFSETRSAIHQPPKATLDVVERCRLNRERAVTAIRTANAPTAKDLLASAISAIQRPLTNRKRSTTVIRTPAPTSPVESPGDPIYEVERPSPIIKRSTTAIRIPEPNEDVSSSALESCSP